MLLQTIAAPVGYGIGGASSNPLTKSLDADPPPREEAGRNESFHRPETGGQHRREGRPYQAVRQAYSPGSAEIVFSS